MHNDLQPEKEAPAAINWTVTLTLGLTFLAAIIVVPVYGLFADFSAWAWVFCGMFLSLNVVGIGSG